MPVIELGEPICGAFGCFADPELARHLRLRLTEVEWHGLLDLPLTRHPVHDPAPRSGSLPDLRMEKSLLPRDRLVLADGDRVAARARHRLQGKPESGLAEIVPPRSTMPEWRIGEYISALGDMASFRFG